MAIKFGAKQRNNPTPAGLNFWVRVFTVSAGIFMLWMPTNNLIGQNTQNAINSILGLLLALSNGLSPLFGIEGAGKYVRTEDVAVMEEPKKEP